MLIDLAMRSLVGPRSADPVSIETRLEAGLGRLSLTALRKRFEDDDEFLVIERFLPEDVLAQWQVELPALLPFVHRVRLFNHKVGGSVDSERIRRHAPSIAAVYDSQSFLDALSFLVGTPLQQCPQTDLHACALYSYSKIGDHIGFHYDTSYYQDRRYTVLIGLVDSSSSRLECRLHTRNPRRAIEERSVQTSPGTLVLFNGDKLLHRVTPVGHGDVRHIITMQFVTESAMRPFHRFVSNMKDALAYFGFRRLLLRRRPSRRAHGASRREA